MNLGFKAIISLYRARAASSIPMLIFLIFFSMSQRINHFLNIKSSFSKIICQHWCQPKEIHMETKKRQTQQISHQQFYKQILTFLYRYVIHTPGRSWTHNLNLHLALTKRGGPFELELLGTTDFVTWHSVAISLYHDNNQHTM